MLNASLNLPMYILSHMILCLIIWTRNFFFPKDPYHSYYKSV